MRKTVLFICLALFFLPAFSVNAQEADSTGTPGDNFSLQGALEMFKKAKSPEEFEKLLNNQDNHVNNLDLNGDGDIDYIRVIDKTEKGSDAHAFVLQVPVSETESQDIAVIELEKTGNEEATLQIIGDEDIFGEQTIVEPDGGDNDKAGAPANGPYFNGMITDRPGIIVNVWLWPCVRFVYAPFYNVWVSPWRWHRYPIWWRPWRPMGWYAFHPYRVRYYTGFAVVHTHRVIRAHRIYAPGRVTSVTVKARHSVAINNYRVTRTKTTVTGPRGNSATRTTTTVRKNGRIKESRTKVRRGRH